MKAFTRYLSSDFELDGVTMPAGSRVMLLYSSANRDERKWQDPDVFDVERDGVARQIGWGVGKHACLGMGLARLEMKVILGALVERVESIEVLEAERDKNMLLHSFKRLGVRLT